MELKTTEEFIRQVYGAACSTCKTKIEKEFPDLFKKQFKEGEWYKRKSEINNSYLIFYITSITKNGTAYGYGIDEDGKWFNVQNQNSNSCACNDYAIKTAEPSTHEEVESAIIAEAKKRGFKKGALCAFGDGKYKRQLETNDFIWKRNRLMVSCNDDSNDIIFQDGIWADILPEEKTIITKEKALKIIAKKLKVSPESIEIK